MRLYHNKAKNAKETVKEVNWLCKGDSLYKGESLYTMQHKSSVCALISVKSICCAAAKSDFIHDLISNQNRIFKVSVYLLRNAESSIA